MWIFLVQASYASDTTLLIALGTFKKSAENFMKYEVNISNFYSHFVLFRVITSPALAQANKVSNTNRFQPRKKCQPFGKIILILGTFHSIVYMYRATRLNDSNFIFTNVYFNLYVLKSWNVMEIEHFRRENIGKQTKCYFNKTLDGGDMIQCPNEVVMAKESRI